MKILIINDDEIVTNLLQEYLSKFYQVDIFESPAKALIHYSKNTDYAILFADYQLEKIPVEEFIKQILQLNPKQKIILSTATMNTRLFDIANKNTENIYLNDKLSDLEMFKALCGSILNESS